MRRVRERERKPLPFDPIAEAWRQWEAHGWAGSAPTMAVVTSVMRVQQMLLRRADSALRGLGLTFALESVNLLSAGKTLIAAADVFLNVGASMLAILAGRAVILAIAGFV